MKCVPTSAVAPGKNIAENKSQQASNLGDMFEPIKSDAYTSNVYQAVVEHNSFITSILE